jgi:hypothetical protein
MNQGHFITFGLIGRRVRRYLCVMNSDQTAVILKRFEAPDEVRVLEKGRFELVHLGGMTIGRATYEPGWKWSEHVGPRVGAAAAGSSTLALCCLAPRRPLSTMGGFSSCEQASSSTSRRYRTTVGWSVSCHMFRCTF